MKDNDMEKQILLASYWEHHKTAKEFSLIYPIKHPKRLRIEKELNLLSNQLNKL